MPSYILKKELVFRHKNEKDTIYRARSAGRIKTHQSYTDLRAWSLECEENRQYFLDIIYHAGLPVKSPAPLDDTTTTADELGSGIEDEKKRDSKLSEVETKSQSQQCDFSENEENVLEDAIQILESAKNLLTESFDASNDCNMEAPGCSDYSKKVRYLDQIEEEQENEATASAFNTSDKRRQSKNRDTHRLETNHHYDTAADTSHYKSKSDFGCSRSNDVKEHICFHHDCTIESPEQSCAQVSSKETLMNSSFHKDTCSYCISCSVSIRHQASGLAVKESLHHNAHTNSRFSDERLRKSSVNYRSSNLEKDRLKSQMTVLEEQVNSQQKEAQKKISLLGKVIARDKKEIAKMKKLLRVEQEHCKDLQMQLQEQITKNLTESDDRSRHYHQRMNGKGSKKKHSDTQIKHSKKFKVVFLNPKKKHLSAHHSSSCSCLADNDLILSNARSNSSVECVKDCTKTRASAKSFREGSTLAGTHQDGNNQETKRSREESNEAENERLKVYRLRFLL